MLSSKFLKKFARHMVTLALSVFVLISLSSCVPSSRAPGVNSSNTAETPTAPSTTPVYQEPSFPMNGIFIQEGSTRTLTNLPLPINFTDSFLIRGLGLSKYLRKLPNTTKVCLVGKYNYVVGSDKFVLLSAKSKSFTDFINKTTEFYLQVEPSNDQANQNDCLTYNLSSAILASGTNPSLSFSLTQVCTTCTTSVTSTPLKLFFNNGEEVPGLPLSQLVLTISGSTSSSTNSCFESTACKARNFDCCLQAQCVKDGAIKPDALANPDFLAAQEDVRNNPSRFVVYPQFYFVCETRPEAPGGGGNTPGTNPNYDASIRILELFQLYQCLNQVDGEFSYCTIKFAEASKMIPGDFSTSILGVKDDVNFSALNFNLGLNENVNNITKVQYAGKVLYERKKTPLSEASFVANTANDDLNTAQSINVTAAIPSNAQDDNLYLTYKIDGTCERVGSALARCTKTYIQAHSNTESTMWHDSSQIFILPPYADTSASSTVIVRISGIVVPEDTDTWSKATNPKRIIFSPLYNIFQNQKVEITYFVTSGVDDLLKSKTSAQVKVNSMCICTSSSKCNLKPILDTAGSIVNFDCTYPSATDNAPPANQTVYVSSKNVPHRYFDTNGVSYDTDFATAPDQEGIAFKYTNNDLLKPNNVTTYIGFNEIYGSFAKTGTQVAKPAKYTRVKKDQLYDIVNTSGAYASCQNCGTDYWTGVQKVFPQNFAGAAGGYTPDFHEARREGNQSIYRSDDLLYGRACFIPATMIPWTHMAASDPAVQRSTRLAGQHILFANGYNRDWYGFDYGSLIGSFDGVSWFSVGNQRRIKASSGKLYLAINGYFGDLSLDNSFTVLVTESSAFSSPIPTHDTESDGAECQRAHFCSTDKECFTTLGYDYVCQNVAGLQTSWPQFDANGSEVVGSVTKSIASILGGTNGQSKRCVYRGRGAPCHVNLNDPSTSFNGALNPGSLGCSTNNVCMATGQTAFNDKIARFGNSPLAQNITEVTNPLGDLIGLGARIIGRPFDFYGSKKIPNSALTSLNANNLRAVCAPGKDLASTTNFGLSRNVPSSRIDTADRILGVGPTTPGTTLSESFLSSCPAVDNFGANIQLSITETNTNNSSTYVPYIRSQNLSTAHLSFSKLRTAGLFNVDGSLPVEKIGYQSNTCLRAPGASCFSDFECAANSFIATKVNNSITTEMNEAEKKFWTEDLTCGNPEQKILDGGVKNLNFDVKKNKCCREIGKTFTVYTEDETSPWRWCNPSPQTTPALAGITMNITSINRYSRAQMVNDKIQCSLPVGDQGRYFAMSVRGDGATAMDKAVNRYQKIQSQFKTLDATNSRMCCTDHWVRSFHKTENGGGHKFGKTHHQDINYVLFKDISWFEQDTTLGIIDPAFMCANDGINHATSACEVRTLTDDDAKPIFELMGGLELIGIPQVAIHSNDKVYKTVNSTNQGPPPLSPLPFEPLEYTTQSVNDSNMDFHNGTERMFSAANYDALKMKTTGAGNTLKKIFSEEEFNCCIPSNTEVSDTTLPEQCCSGTIISNDGPKRCCLDDYTDVTVYLNRYVSSEGRGLPDNSYDPNTGYITDPGLVHQLASQKNLCCSGQTLSGRALSDLHIPIAGNLYRAGADSKNLSRRFYYRTDAVDNNADTNFVADFVNAGIKWNTHVYCVPKAVADQANK